MAQVTLQRFVGEWVGPWEELVGPESSLGVWVYLDDILVLAPDQELCGLVARGILEGIKRRGLVMSPNSVFVPTQQLDW